MFPDLGRTFWPKKGTAVFWYNLYKNGEGDVRTRHAACPVLAGTKWGMYIFLFDCWSFLPFRRLFWPFLTIFGLFFSIYRISSYRLWPLISVHKCAETIQGRKLFKGGNYMRKYSSHRKVKKPSTQEISETIGCRIYG